jgi:transcriptional regulator with XRE-family HTH domain
MPRKLSRPRPTQGARLLALRQAAAISQADLARTVGESQQNIALWEQSEKPPRSDVLPKIAKALGVSIEVLLNVELAQQPQRRPGPAGKVGKLFDEVSKLPRRQQDKIVEFLSPIVEDYKRRRTG